VSKLLLVPRVPLLVADLPHHVVVVVVVGWEHDWLMASQLSFLCAGTSLLMFMSWLGDSGRLTTTSVVRPLPWVCLLLPARLMCPSILLRQRLMNDTSKPMGFHSCQQKMKKVKRKNFLITESSMSRLPTKGIRIHLLPILLPRIHLAAILPQLSLGRKLCSKFGVADLRSISSLVICGCFSPPIFGARCQKGGK
jgi:hypothetical protein